MIGFLLRLSKERRADILAAGKEHAIHLSHDLSHIGIGKVLCLDLVCVGLLKHPTLLQIGAGHLVAAVILHSRGSDLGQLHRHTACCTDHSGKCSIILRIALPADTDKRLAFHGLSIGHHLNEHSLVHCAVRAVLHSLSQASAGCRSIIAGRPGSQDAIGNIRIPQQDRRRLYLGRCRIGREGITTRTTHQTLCINQVDSSLIDAVLSHIRKRAGFRLVLCQLTGQAGTFYQQCRHFSSGHGVWCCGGCYYQSRSQGTSRTQGQEFTKDPLLHFLNSFLFAAMGCCLSHAPLKVTERQRAHPFAMPFQTIASITSKKNII